MLNYSFKCADISYKNKVNSATRVTLLFAVQMKLTVDPTLTVWALGSSTVTSMALVGTPGEMQKDSLVYVDCS